MTACHLRGTANTYSLRICPNGRSVPIESALTLVEYVSPGNLNEPSRLEYSLRWRDTAATLSGARRPCQDLLPAGETNQAWNLIRGDRCLARWRLRGLEPVRRSARKTEAPPNLAGLLLKWFGARNALSSRPAIAGGRGSE